MNKYISVSISDESLFSETANKQKPTRPLINFNTLQVKHRRWRHVQLKHWPRTEEHVVSRATSGLPGQTVA